MMENTLSLTSIAKALGGDRCGTKVYAPAPGHSAKDRQLCVSLDPRKSHGLSVAMADKDSCEDWRDLKDYVCDRLGLPRFEPNSKFTVRPIRPAAPAKTPIEDAARIRRALAIWNHAVDPRDTVVEHYLNSRALSLPDNIAGRVVRYNTQCPWGEGGEVIAVPAMIVLLRDIATNEPRGIQKTRLTPEGLKVERKSQGIAGGAAIKIDPDTVVEQARGLAIGEGFESSLTGRQKGFRPTWAAMSKGGIANFPILEAVKILHIFTENDANGASEIAVTQCFHRWKATGRRVIRVIPEPEFNDLNDELKREAGL